MPEDVLHLGKAILQDNMKVQWLTETWLFRQKNTYWNSEPLTSTISRHPNQSNQGYLCCFAPMSPSSPSPLRFIRMPNDIGHWIFVDSGSTEVKTNDSNKDLGCIVRWRTSCDRCNSGNQGSRDMSETRTLGCIQEIDIYIYMIFTDICVCIYIYLHIISMYPLSLGTDSPKVMFRNEVVAGQTSGGSKTIKRKSRIGMFCYKQYSQGNFSYFLDQYYDQQGLHTLCHRSQIFLDPDWINSAQTQVGCNLGCPFWRMGLAGIRLYIYG